MECPSSKSRLLFHVLLRSIFVLASWVLVKGSEICGMHSVRADFVGGQGGFRGPCRVCRAEPVGSNNKDAEPESSANKTSCSCMGIGEKVVLVWENLL